MTNILCVSLYDNGGQMQQLTDAINKYSTNNARHLNFKQTYLNYNLDINAANYRNEELIELLNDRDFFIFSELIPDRFNDLNFNLTRTNSIIRCFGSITRNNLNFYRNTWSKNFITFTSGGFDPTIHPYLGFVAYHIPNIYDFSKFPKPNKSNKIRICHASTNNKIKSTNKVINILSKLKNDFEIEPALITNTSWENSLKIKSTCHITIDQFKLGTYASSAIESMYLKNVVVSQLSPFIISMHPDIPIVQSTEIDLYNTIKKLLSNYNNIDKIGELGKEYALKEHDAKTNIIKWDKLIEWVHSGFK